MNEIERMGQRFDVQDIVSIEKLMTKPSEAHLTFLAPRDLYQYHHGHDVDTAHEVMPEHHMI